MPSLPQSLIARLAVLRESSLLRQKTETGRTTLPHSRRRLSVTYCITQTYTSPIGPDGIHARVLKELAGVLAKLLSIIYHQSWLTGEVPTDWKLASVTPRYKKGQKDDLGNYRPVSLTLVPRKLMEQLILSTIIQHMRDNHISAPVSMGL